VVLVVLANEICLESRGVMHRRPDRGACPPTDTRRPLLAARSTRLECQRRGWRSAPCSRTPSRAWRAAGRRHAARTDDHFAGARLDVAVLRAGLSVLAVDDASRASSTLDVARPAATGKVTRAIRSTRARAVGANPIAARVVAGARDMAGWTRALERAARAFAALAVTIRARRFARRACLAIGMAWRSCTRELALRAGSTRTGRARAVLRTARVVGIAPLGASILWRKPRCEPRASTCKQHGQHQERGETRATGPRIK
jgi:hypothetical protein